MEEEVPFEHFPPWRGSYRDAGESSRRYGGGRDQVQEGAGGGGGGAWYQQSLSYGNVHPRGMRYQPLPPPVWMNPEASMVLEYFGGGGDPRGTIAELDPADAVGGGTAARVIGPINSGAYTAAMGEQMGRWGIHRPAMEAENWYWFHSNMDMNGPIPAILPLIEIAGPGRGQLVIRDMTPTWTIGSFSLQFLLWFQLHLTGAAVTGIRNATGSTGTTRWKYQMLLISPGSPSVDLAAGDLAMPTHLGAGTIVQNTSQYRQWSEMSWHSRVAPMNVRGMLAGAAPPDDYIEAVYSFSSLRFLQTRFGAANVRVGFMTSDGYTAGHGETWRTITPCVHDVVDAWIRFCDQTEMMRQWNDLPELFGHFPHGAVDLYDVRQLDVYPAAIWPAQVRIQNYIQFRDEIRTGARRPPDRGMFRAGAWFPYWVKCFAGEGNEEVKRWLHQVMDMYVSVEHFQEVNDKDISLAMTSLSIGCFYKAIQYSGVLLREELVELERWLLGFEGEHAVPHRGVIDVADSRRLIRHIAKATTSAREASRSLPLLLVVTYEEGTSCMQGASNTNPYVAGAPWRPRRHHYLSETIERSKEVTSERSLPGGSGLLGYRVIELGLHAGHWFPVVPLRSLLGADVAISRRVLTEWLNAPDREFQPFLQWLKADPINRKPRGGRERVLDSFDFVRTLLSDGLRFRDLHQIKLEEVFRGKRTFESVNVLQKPPTVAIYERADVCRMVKTVTRFKEVPGGKKASLQQGAGLCSAHFVVDYEDASRTHLPYCAAIARVDGARSASELHGHVGAYWLVGPRDSSFSSRGGVFEFIRTSMDGCPTDVSTAGAGHHSRRSLVGLWAHNMTYDFVHIIEDATAAGGRVVPDSLVIHGNKIVTIRLAFPQWNLEVACRDSWRLLGGHVSVAKMPEMFGFVGEIEGGVEKELFFHDWLSNGEKLRTHPTLDSWFEMSDLRREVTTLMPHAVQPFDWASFVRKVDPWCDPANKGRVQLYRYAMHYCSRDVVITARALALFAADVKELTQGKVNALECLSASSLADAYYRSEGVYDGVLALDGLLGGYFRQFATGGRCCTAYNWPCLRSAPGVRYVDVDARSLYPTAMVRLVEEHGGFLCGAPDKLDPRMYPTMRHLLADPAISGFFVATSPLLASAPAPNFYPLGLYPIKPNRDGTNTAGDEGGDDAEEEEQVSVIWVNDLRVGRPHVPETLYWDIVSIRDYLCCNPQYGPQDFSVLHGYVFRNGRNAKVGEVVHRLYNQRKTATTKSMQQVYKLYLNGAYGMLLKHPHLTGTRVLPTQGDAVDYMRRRPHLVINGVAMTQDRTPHWMVTSRRPFADSHSRVHVGAEVLSMSRAVMNRVAAIGCGVPRFAKGLGAAPLRDIHLGNEGTGVLPPDVIAYSDTDSLHVSEVLYNDVLRALEGEDLGQFHLDFPGAASQVVWLGKKMYAFEFRPEDPSRVEMALKGVPRASISLRVRGDWSRVFSEVFEALFRGDSLTFDLDAIETANTGSMRANFTLPKFRCGLVLQSSPNARKRTVCVDPSRVLPSSQNLTL